MAGCKCKDCGKTRDEGHDWQRARCKTCGKTKDLRPEQVVAMRSGHDNAADPEIAISVAVASESTPKPPTARHANPDITAIRIVLSTLEGQLRQQRNTGLPITALEVRTVLARDCIAWIRPDDGSQFDSDRASDILATHMQPLGVTLGGGGHTTAGGIWQCVSGSFEADPANPKREPSSKPAKPNAEEYDQDQAEKTVLDHIRRYLHSIDNYDRADEPFESLIAVARRNARALSTALESPDLRVRATAIRALLYSGTKDAIPFLVQVLRFNWQWSRLPKDKPESKRCQR